jgi:hypothetical protein
MASTSKEGRPPGRRHTPDGNERLVETSPADLPSTEEHDQLIEQESFEDGDIIMLSPTPANTWATRRSSTESSLPIRGKEYIAPNDDDEQPERDPFSGTPASSDTSRNTSTVTL